jgi:TPR repeat protein
MKKSFWVLLFLVSGLIGPVGAAQQRLPEPAEAERRNAAAAFIAGREMSLAMLHRACGDLPKGEKLSIAKVTRDWLTRNHRELEASDAWLRRYFAYLNDQYPELAQSQADQLRQVTSGVVLQAIKTHFKGEVPNVATCDQAARSYSDPRFDVRNLNAAPGYETFGEFGETLQRIQREPDFSVQRTPGKRYDDMVAEAARRPSAAWLAAADAAGERGDERARVAIFEKLAKEGDAKSAQTVGLAYYRGDGNVTADLQRAYRWFYQAWALGDLDGLNALGVMINEGQAVARNAELAFATFALVKAGASPGPTQQRAVNNLAPLASSIPESGRRSLACATLGQLDKKLDSLVPAGAEPVRKRALSHPDRRLGEISDDLAPHYSRDACASSRGTL